MLDACASPALDKYSGSSKIVLIDPTSVSAWLGVTMSTYVFSGNVSLEPGESGMLTMIPEKTSFKLRQYYKIPTDNFKHTFHQGGKSRLLLEDSICLCKGREYYHLIIQQETTIKYMNCLNKSNLLQLLNAIND